jgi:hypothetical protein
MLSAARFLWNATSGHRLRPWRSDFLKWRIETYSGMKAETMTTGDIFRFVWEQKWALLKFLHWTDKLETEIRRVAHRATRAGS